MSKVYFLSQGNLWPCKEMSQNLEVRVWGWECAQELTVGHGVPRARAKLNSASFKEIKHNYHPQHPMYERKWRLRNLKARPFLRCGGNAARGMRLDGRSQQIEMGFALRE